MYTHTQNVSLCNLSLPSVDNFISVFYNRTYSFKTNSVPITIINIFNSRGFKKITVLISKLNLYCGYMSYLIIM